MFFVIDVFGAGDHELDRCALRIAQAECCRKCCIMSHYKGEPIAATRFIRKCFDESKNMSSSEWKQYIRSKIFSSMKSVKNSSNYAKHVWMVGTGPNDFIEGVCRTCFSNCYSTSRTTMLAVVKELKSGAVEAAPSFRVNQSVSPILIAAIIRSAGSCGKELSAAQLGLLQIPNTYDSVSCYSWMNNYFNLEPITIKEVWTEYVEDMMLVKEGYIRTKAFGSMWAHCFPYVRIREFKAVTGKKHLYISVCIVISVPHYFVVSGKCNTCAWLSHARRTFRDKKNREQITIMHALHRSTYMGERIEYRNRRQLAHDLPTYNGSFISDGMAQIHCMLPHQSMKTGTNIIFFCDAY